jgi:hypothetical protein
MKTIACLAAVLAASAGLGCRGNGQSKPSAGDPPAAESAKPAAPSAEAPAASAKPAAPPADPAAAPAAPVTREYAGDIEKLCDVVRLSGVGSARTDDRLVPIANWLAANLATLEARRFLVHIQPLGGTRKADALDAEARRVGLPGCNLAAEWRAPPTP